MRRILKWVGIAVGGLVGVIVIAALVLFLLGGRKLNKDYDIIVVPIAVPDDPEAVARGEHFVETIGLCQECHGNNLAGEVLNDDPVFGKLVPSNLTSGKGGIGGTFTDIDYVRAIRHGVGPSGKPLVLMPSEFFTKINDTDLGAIIAYLKSLPPVDNELPKTKLGPLGRMVTLMDGALVPASIIEHDAPRPREVEPAVTPGYGEYLAFICSICHGDNLAGGSVPGEDGDAPLAPNLTPKGVLSKWSDVEFVNTLRTGTTPQGKRLDNEFMPWQHFRGLTDDELTAIYLYLTSLPPRDTNS